MQGKGSGFLLDSHIVNHRGRETIYGEGIVRKQQMFCDTEGMSFGKKPFRCPNTLSQYTGEIS